MNEKTLLAGLQWFQLEKFQKGHLRNHVILALSTLLEETGAASGRVFWHWTEQDYCKTNSAKLETVGSGTDLSLM